MKHRECNYTKAIIICPGKTEFQMCQFIKSNLRLPVEIVINKIDFGLLTIKNINKFLEYESFKNFRDFKKTFINVNYNKNQLPTNLKIFIILNTLDSSILTQNEFKNKNMFRAHWLFQYIYPIYNITSFEEVLKKANIKYTEKNLDPPNKYIQIFPLDAKYLHKNDYAQIQDFSLRMSKIENTNMFEMINYLLKC